MVVKHIQDLQVAMIPVTGSFALEDANWKEVYRYSSMPWGENQVIVASNTVISIILPSGSSHNRWLYMDLLNDHLCRHVPYAVVIRFLPCKKGGSYGNYLSFGVKKDVVGYILLAGHR